MRMQGAAPKRGGPAHESMSIREEYEKRERNFLSPFGCLSSASRGRRVPEPSCPVRTAFQLDCDRIVYSNAFRRLKHKTQVFLAPLGDEYRTRLTHTLEVAQMARKISRAMFLNEDLAEAIALGHDLGHTPFGHGGETVLKEVHSAGFSHSDQSLRVVDYLENNGQGLNLSWEVRDGILKHSKGFGDIIPDSAKDMAATLEGRVVRIADMMAYLNHDLEDAVRSGVISAAEVPADCRRILGATHRERAAIMIRDIISSSVIDQGQLRLRLSGDVHRAITDLRRFLYNEVYRSDQVHGEFVKAKKILSELYTHFLENPPVMKMELARQGIEGWLNGKRSWRRIVCDFIASLTDRAAMNLYSRLFFPTPQI
jgi:dGTPase